MTSPITTHVLDTSAGQPAQGIAVILEMESSEGWKELGRGTTDADGRVANLLPAGQLVARKYRLRFHIGPYFLARKISSFYPLVEITFEVADAAQQVQ